MNAQKLKIMIRMMRLMSLEDLEIKVEARATELIETEDMYDEPSIGLKFKVLFDQNMNQYINEWTNSSSC